MKRRNINPITVGWFLAIVSVYTFCLGWLFLAGMLLGIALKNLAITLGVV